MKTKTFKIVKVSEWDVRAIISYALIHHYKLFIKELNKNINKDIINKSIDNLTFSWNSKKPLKNWSNKNILFKKMLFISNKIINNHPNIKDVKGKDIKEIDLFFYSFPCQGLSIANMGRSKGINKNSNSTSNIIWEIYRILNEANKQKIQLPKYLLMENVTALINKKHINDYKSWLEFLQKLGYQNFSFEVDSINHGSVQKRKRLFCLSILKNKFKRKILIKNEEFKSLFKKFYESKFLIKKQEERYFNVFKKSKQYEDELMNTIIKKTPSRIKMKETSKNLLEIKNQNYFFKTLTTKQDRIPNIGIIKLNSLFIKKNNIDLNENLNYRFITPREAFLIMGFENKDFNNIKKYWFEKKILTKESLYRQAGNSIVVPVLESIFKFIENIQKNKHKKDGL